MNEERKTNLNCPNCFNGPLWTDDDIEWCNKCDFSRAVAAKPVHYNQHTKAGTLLAAKREAKKYVADRADVTGVGVGDNRVRIYLKDAEGRLGIPDTFGGFLVEFVVTGEIKAL